MNYEAQHRPRGPPTGLAPVTNSAGPYRHPFGKHKGKTLHEIQESDPQYLTWLRAIYMAQTSEELQSALAQHDTSTPSSLHDEAPKITRPRDTTTNHPPNTAQNSSPRGDSKAVKGEHILPFGVHCGKKLSEVPEIYISNLRTRIASGTFTPKPDLLVALQNHKPTQSPINTKPTKWIPPDYEAADSFQVLCRFEELWIAHWDAKKYFGLTNEHVAMLPLADGSTRMKPRYWL